MRFIASLIAATTIPVHTPAQFQSAVEQLRPHGGTIVLLAGRYDSLTVSGRVGGRLRIVGRPGARVQNLLLDGTRYVTVGPLKVVPLSGDALVEVRASHNIVLRDLTVSARGSPWSAGVDIPDSSWVTVQQSEFSHCGDRSPNWVNCLRVQDQASHVLVDHDWFHDCLGCDFLHGRIHDHLTVRSSRFERALPCDLRKIDRHLLRIDLGRYAVVRSRRRGP
jgi:hypothetical protein